MKNYFAAYMAPVAVLDDWMKLDEATRKEQEIEMKAEWDAWESKHAAHLEGETAGLGKTKRVTSSGVESIRSDYMLYSIVKAVSLDEAAAMFEGHPHFKIPQAWIEVVEINALRDM